MKRTYLSFVLDHHRGRTVSLALQAVEISSAQTWDEFGFL